MESQQTCRSSHYSSSMNIWIFLFLVYFEIWFGRVFHCKSPPNDYLFHSVHTTIVYLTVERSSLKAKCRSQVVTHLYHSFYDPDLSNVVQNVLIDTAISCIEDQQEIDNLYEYFCKTLTNEMDIYLRYSDAP